MTYTHITQDERYQIAILAKAGHDRSDIARVMNRNKSTIGREMTRNSGQRGYRPKQANEFAHGRKQARENGRRVSAETWAFVDAKLSETWSPEQIAGYVRANDLPIAKKLAADFYFAHPYASWERGANENMNGLIRQFFPKKMAFDDITDQDIAFVTHRLNHRPRKCLGFKTPHEVFMNQLQSHHSGVALQT